MPREHFETLADLPASLVGPLFQNAQLLERAIEEGEPLAELDTSAPRCLDFLRGGMKCEDSFVAGGNASCSSAELLESLSSHG